MLPLCRLYCRPRRQVLPLCATTAVLVMCACTVQNAPVLELSWYCVCTRYRWGQPLLVLGLAAAAIVLFSAAIGHTVRGARYKQTLSSYALSSTEIVFPRTR
eukprot:3773656-Rhodomonas_salina.2